MGPPVSDEIAAALAAFVHGGQGPSHSQLTTAFASAGYGDAAPYDTVTGTPNKQQRTYATVRAAMRRQDRARDLVEAILTRLRLAGYFREDRSSEDAEKVRNLRDALRRSGWMLTGDGELRTLSGIDLTTGGRKALDEQMDRLRRSTEDPALLLGTAKDLLEAVAKFVLEEVGMPVSGHPSFNHLWYLARERLGVLPQQVDTSLPGAKQIREIHQSTWKIAEQVNELRALQGTGHGRTLPTGVSSEMALLIVREACSVAEYMLTSLDKAYGRR